VVLQAPAQLPAKKLLLPVPPEPEIQLTIFVVLQTLNVVGILFIVLAASLNVLLNSLNVFDNSTCGIGIILSLVSYL
jgi:hypothetical protein